MIFNQLLFTVAQALEGKPGDVEIPRPTLTADTIQQGLQLFFGIAGGVALLVILISAIRYTLSRGDANAIKSSKESIIYALIGLAVCLTGYSFVALVLNNL